MKNELKLYVNIIKKNGYQFTKQKEKILSELLNSDTHLSAKEIYEKVKADKIGVATVYRTLKAFKKLGIVKEIYSNGINYYEIKIYSGNPLHIHFKCLNCQSISDVECSELNTEYIKLNNLIEQKKNLEIQDVNIMLIGICNKCNNKGIK